MGIVFDNKGCYAQQKLCESIFIDDNLFLFINQLKPTSRIHNSLAERKCKYSVELIK